MEDLIGATIVHPSNLFTHISQKSPGYCILQHMAVITAIQHSHFQEVAAAGSNPTFHNYEYPILIDPFCFFLGGFYVTVHVFNNDISRKVETSYSNITNDEYEKEIRFTV